MSSKELKSSVLSGDHVLEDELSLMLEVGDDIVSEGSSTSNYSGQSSGGGGDRLRRPRKRVRTSRGAKRRRTNQQQRPPVVSTGPNTSAVFNETSSWQQLSQYNSSVAVAGHPPLPHTLLPPHLQVGSTPSMVPQHPPGAGAVNSQMVILPASPHHEQQQHLRQQLLVGSGSSPQQQQQQPRGGRLATEGTSGSLKLQVGLDPTQQQQPIPNWKVKRNRKVSLQQEAQLAVLQSTEVSRSKERAMYLQQADERSNRQERHSTTLYAVPGSRSQPTQQQHQQQQISSSMRQTLSQEVPPPVQQQSIMGVNHAPPGRVAVGWPGVPPPDQVTHESQPTTFTMVPQPMVPFQQPQLMQYSLASPFLLPQQQQHQGPHVSMQPVAVAPQQHLLHNESLAPIFNQQIQQPQLQQMMGGNVGVSMQPPSMWPGLGLATGSPIQLAGTFTAHQPPVVQQPPGPQDSSPAPPSLFRH